MRNERLTQTRRGVGVFVHDFQPIVSNRIVGESQRQWGMGRANWDADDDGRQLNADGLKVDPADLPTDAVRKMLDLDPGAAVAVRDRRFALEGKPVILATLYLPARSVDGSRIAEPDTGPGGTYARLADFGHTPAHFREYVVARNPSASESEALDFMPGTPVVVIPRIAITEDGVPVEVNRMPLDAAAFVVRYEFDV